MVELEKATPDQIKKELDRRVRKRRENSIDWGVAEILGARSRGEIEVITKSRVVADPYDNSHPENRRTAYIVRLKHWVN